MEPSGSLPKALTLTKKIADVFETAEVFIPEAADLLAKLNLSQSARTLSVILERLDCLSSSGHIHAQLYVDQYTAALNEVVLRFSGTDPDESIEKILCKLHNAPQELIRPRFNSDDFAPFAIARINLRLIAAVLELYLSSAGFPSTNFLQDQVRVLQKLATEGKAAQKRSSGLRSHSDVSIAAPTYKCLEFSSKGSSPPPTYSQPQNIETQETWKVPGDATEDHSRERPILLNILGWFINNRRITSRSQPVIASPPRPQLPVTSPDHFILEAGTPRDYPPGPPPSLIYRRDSPAVSASPDQQNLTEEGASRALKVVVIYHMHPFYFDGKPSWSRVTVSRQSVSPIEEANRILKFQKRNKDVLEVKENLSSLQQEQIDGIPNRVQRSERHHRFLDWYLIAINPIRKGLLEVIVERGPKKGMSAVDVYREANAMQAAAPPPPRASATPNYSDFDDSASDSEEDAGDVVTTLLKQLTTYGEEIE